MQPRRNPRVSGSIYKERRKDGEVWRMRLYAPVFPSGESRRTIGRAHEGKTKPSVGTYTRRTAQEKLEETLVDLRARVGVMGRDGHMRVPFTTASQEWLRYVEHDRGRTLSTVDDYKSVVRVHLDPEFDGLFMDEVGVEHVDEFRERLLKLGRSPRTINKCLALLHGIFKRAQRKWGLPSNPVAAAERQPERRSSDFRVLSPVEVAAVARVIRPVRRRGAQAGTAAEAELLAALVITAAFTGLRMGELRALRWCDIEWQLASVFVRKNRVRTETKDPKSHRVRSVPMIDDVARALDGLSKRTHFTSSSDLVFCNAVGEPLDDNSIRRAFRGALKAAELEAMRFHDLRHSFGTLAVRVWPVTEVQAYMGHSDIQTTMRYVHHMPRHKAAAELSRLVSGPLSADEFVQREAGLGAPRTI